MGKKGKAKYFQVEDDVPKKKAMITEQQLMDKSHMDKTQFIPMLPEQSLYEPYIFNQKNQAAIIKITSDLNYLLYVDFKQFWATVLYNPFLKHCLSSCLTHLHRRWMNKYEYSRQSREQFENSEQYRQKYRNIFLDPVCEYSIGLTQVLLLVYHRIVSFNYQNKQLSSLYKIGEQISKRYILDLPRLLQLCEIYGETNGEIVRYIIKMYGSITPQFYKMLTGVIMPQMMRKVEDTIRFVKNLTDREQYGVNYNYKRMSGYELSQGEQQLKKKVLVLLQFISFIEVLKSVMEYFPENCIDYCFYNSQVQFCLENIYLELEVAYKVWNYQTQDVKMLGMINYILKFCVDYFVRYFDRCNTIFVLRPKKVSSEQAYINSLERVFKDFGRRSTLSRKNQSRSLLMYKIVQKEMDIHSMVHSIYKNEEEENGFGFNLQYLKEIIIAFDNQFKDEYINQEEPRQEEIEEQTQADFQNNDKEIDEQQIRQSEVKRENEDEVVKQQQKDNLAILETLVPKRMRSEDYYLKLYADYNKKFYKGEYEDDYDEIADYDKRPVFLDDQQSSESEEQLERHLISNTQNLQRINSMNKGRFTANRNDIRLKNTNQPKYSRVQNNTSQVYQSNSNKNTNTNKKYVERVAVQEPSKKKYVLKGAQSEGREQIRRQDDFVNESGQNPVQYRVRDEGVQENRGGQGFKKNNKSYNYKPKEHHQNNKGRNTNKTKDYKHK